MLLSAVLCVGKPMFQTSGFSCLVLFLLFHSSNLLKTNVFVTCFFFPKLSALVYSRLQWCCVSVLMSLFIWIRVVIVCVSYCISKDMYASCLLIVCWYTFSCHTNWIYANFLLLLLRLHFLAFHHTSLPICLRRYKRLPCCFHCWWFFVFVSISFCVFVPY